MIRHCIHCGKEINPNTQFCTHCGKKIVHERSKRNIKVVSITILAIVLVVSIIANVLLWNAYRDADNKAAQVQELSESLTGVQDDLCSRIVDYAVSEYELREESFRMLSDCYEGNPPRESDYDRMLEKVYNTDSTWQDIEEYINSFEGEYEPPVMN